MTFEGLLVGVASPLPSPAAPPCGVPDRRTEGLKDGQWNANPVHPPAALAAVVMPPKEGGGFSGALLLMSLRLAHLNVTGF